MDRVDEVDRVDSAERCIRCGSRDEVIGGLCRADRKRCAVCRHCSIGPRLSLFCEEHSEYVRPRDTCEKFDRKVFRL